MEDIVNRILDIIGEQSRRMDILSERIDMVNERIDKLKKQCDGK